MNIRKIAFGILLPFTMSVYAQSHIVTVTTYQAKASQCDSDPLTTADGTKIKPHKVNNGSQRIIAVSRDLLKKFPYGSKVHVDGFGYFEVHDTMNKRFTSRIDILIPNHEKGTMKKNVKIRKV